MAEDCASGVKEFQQGRMKTVTKIRRDYGNLQGFRSRDSWIIDWAHRIGVTYVDKTSKKSCKSVIVRFSTFRHRSIVYRAKQNVKCPVRVKIDLMKKRHKLLLSANKYVSNIHSVTFCYADINCRLQIKWEDESINDTFFLGRAEESH